MTQTITLNENQVDTLLRLKDNLNIKGNGDFSNDLIEIIEEVDRFISLYKSSELLSQDKAFLDEMNEISKSGVDDGIE